MIFAAPNPKPKIIFLKSLKFFNYYKYSNLISEPPRKILRGAAALWCKNGFFWGNHNKGWRGFFSAPAPTLNDLLKAMCLFNFACWLWGK